MLNSINYYAASCSTLRDPGLGYVELISGPIFWTFWDFCQIFEKIRLKTLPEKHGPERLTNCYVFKK